MPDTNGRPGAGQSAAEARAEYEARRAATRGARERRLAEAFPLGDPGSWVGTVSVVATIAFAAATVAAAVDPDRFIKPFFAVAVALFTAGMMLFAWVLVGMALRSRDDVLSVAGVFFLAGSAPRSARSSLLGSLIAQIVIATIGAAVRPFTPLAVATLVPIFGLAATGFWAVRYGHFDAHQPEHQL